MANVTVYSKDNCPFCVAAKNLLNQKGIAFEEIKIALDDREGFMALQKKTGMRTVPQIFHGERLIGGFDSLSALDKKDGLASLKG